MELLKPLVGLVVFCLLAAWMSTSRASISRRIVVGGFLLQMLFAILVLGIPAIDLKGPLRFIFVEANDLIMAILEFTDKGSNFLFGDLVKPDKFGFIIAFKVLPVIIFFSSLMGVAYYLGVMQFIVKAISKLMQKSLKTSGAESLAAAANIFVGQTEAPLMVRPFLAKMTQSELFCMMVGGFATVAGSVMAAYVLMLKDRIPDIAGHLLTASVMSAPAALMIAKVMVPEVETPETLNGVPKSLQEDRPTNVFEAAAKGASDGLMLALNVAAMLIAFIALVALVDAGFAALGQAIGFENWGQGLVPELLRVQGETTSLSFSLIVGWLFSPVAWLMGVPWDEASLAGVLIGQKLVLNEFVAYSNLSLFMNQLSDKTVIVMSYALCGFANFSSIGIQIGGIGSLAPGRKTDLARLGFRAVIGGSLAAFMTACWASLLI